MQLYHLQSDQGEAEGTWGSVNHCKDTMCHSHLPRASIVSHGFKDLIKSDRQNISKFSPLEG